MSGLKIYQILASDSSRTGWHYAAESPDAAGRMAGRPANDPSALYVRDVHRSDHIKDAGRVSYDGHGGMERIPDYIP
jgi:hypothetical protein